MADLKWVFDPGPPSGESQGGDLAKKAFNLNLNTFVREVLQNSKDANNNKHVRDKPAEVTFKLIELSGKEVTKFLETINWEKLSWHLKHGATGDYEHMLDEIIELVENKKLRLLLIEDNNTTGLFGREFEDDTPFKSLIKDKLKSSKDDESAGGSHGLGKTVLWGFSAFSTVFFYSKIHEKLKGDLDQLRFIGRTGIPSHNPNNDRGYSGSGWFGIEKKRDYDKNLSYAESLFQDEAKSIAENIYMERNQNKTGTSILVFGFREPMISEHREAEDVVSDLKHSAAEWFWPTMTKKEPGLIVRTELYKNGELIEKDKVEPERHKELRPFIKAYKDFNEGDVADDFESGQGTVMTNVSIDIPKKRDQSHDAFTGKLKVLVRLADNKSNKTNQVARFRGQGMIIDYLNTGDLALDAQKYHAVLVAGEASGSSTQEKNIDRFLRFAEPPEHKDWTSTEKLSNKYFQPYAQPLKDLTEDIKDAIRKLVTEESKPGSKVPPELLNRFKLGSSNGGFIKESEFNIKMDAFVKDGIWEFNASVKPKFNIEKDWHVKVYPRFSEEDSPFSKGDLDLIENIEAHCEGRKIEDIKMVDGYVQITIPQKYDETYIKGITSPNNYPVELELGSFELKIEGEK